MSINKYQPHLVVLPEDDADRQIANGFILDSNLNDRAIQILPPAGGWGKVVEQFLAVHVPEMRKFPERFIVLLIDFDDQQDTRFDYVKNQIPDEIIDRVFIIGVLSEPEALRAKTNKNFETIGETLAKDCSQNTNELWGHELLRHNKAELDRIVVSVKPFLFK
ncbi:hypothetical protein [Anabaena azotica]|uniref:Uncharacterized protein n=1 Tax=Anabaena azotica FACHB-119 TaxID=947527 RepID=A0ABR8D7R4_9NOST|nr:hypothetical protein [Anabaena azotica]MBD2502468.1 hypothetical protein [Anabaena azotica FACHB-119]